MIKDRKALLFFLFPVLAGFLVFYFIPFVGGLYYCLVNNALEKKFVGLDNFINLFKNPAFLLAMKNTFILTFITVPLILVISFTIAYFIRMFAGKKNLLRKAFVLPLAIPTASVAGLWLLVFSGNGAINKGLGIVLHDFRPDWFGEKLIYIPIVLIYIWKYSGLNIMLFLGGLSSVPQELYEASSVDGFTRLMQIRKIILPYIFPITFFVTILSIINSFKIFKEVYMLCGSYPPQSMYLLQHFINNNFTKLNYERLTTAAYVFAYIIFMLVFILMKIERKNVSDSNI